MDYFRWLTVGVVGQPEVAFALMEVPGPPVFEPDTSAAVKELMAKGAAGGYFFATEDCQATYEDLKGRGVEFQMEPTRMPYGVDAAFAIRRATASVSRSGWTDAMCLIHLVDERATRHASSAVPVGYRASDDDEYVVDDRTTDDNVLLYDLVVDLIVSGANWAA